MAEPRTPKTPASALAPVAPRRAARTATRAAGTGQPDPPAVPTPGGSGPNSSLQPSERQAAGKPGPVPGTHGGLDDSSRASAGSRAEASRSPAGTVTRSSPVRRADGAVPTGPEARYAAARAKALAAQARKRPADPQQVPRRADPRAAVAEMMRPCTCTHPALNHWQTESGRVTWCSIATGAGPCGCELYQRAPGVVA